MSLATRVSDLAGRVAQEFKSIRTALGLKADKNSPVFTGTPTIPVAGWVNAQHIHSGPTTGGQINLSDVVGFLTVAKGGTGNGSFLTNRMLVTGPNSGDALKELPQGTVGQSLITNTLGLPIWANLDSSLVSDLSDLLDAKAPKVSPVFTGTPTIPTTGWTNAQHTHTGPTTGGQIAISSTSGTLSTGRGGTGSTTLSGNALISTGATAVDPLVKVDPGEAGQILRSFGPGVRPAFNDLEIPDINGLSDAISQQVSAAVADAIANSVTPGTIRMSAANTLGDGWLYCNGSSGLRADYPELFAAIGTAFGAGDGSTTFTIPDFSGFVPIGSGVSFEPSYKVVFNNTIGTFSGSGKPLPYGTGTAVKFTSVGGSLPTGLSSSTTYYVYLSGSSYHVASSLANALASVQVSFSSTGSGTITAKALPIGVTISAGDTYGEGNHVLDQTELAPHAHTTKINTSASFGAPAGTTTYNINNSGADRTSTTGSAAPMNNIQPSLGVNFFIKY